MYFLTCISISVINFLHSSAPFCIGKPEGVKMAELERRVEDLEKDKLSTGKRAQRAAHQKNLKRRAPVAEYDSVHQKTCRYTFVFS